HVRSSSQSKGGRLAREPTRTGSPRARRRSTIRRPVLPVPPRTRIGLWSCVLITAPFVTTLLDGAGKRPRRACPVPGIEEIAAAKPRQPNERRQCEPLEPARADRRLHLVRELAREEGELERLGDAAEHRPPLLGEGDGRLEEPLHLERGPDLDPNERRLVAVVGEVVRHARRNHDQLAWLRDDPLPP